MILNVEKEVSFMMLVAILTRQFNDVDGEKIAIGCKGQIIAVGKRHKISLEAISKKGFFEIASKNYLLRRAYGSAGMKFWVDWVDE
jgi:hypothetical protein